MVIEGITILYYTLATISLVLVLYQKYNHNIDVCIKKYFYNYDVVSNESPISNSNPGYVLFREHDIENTNDYTNDYTNQNNQNNQNNENNQNNQNNQNNENNQNNNKNNNEIKSIRTKKNVIIDFE